MKTISTIVVAMLCFFSASAQFDVANFSASLSGNYTMFKGDFQQKAAGGKIDLGYSLTSKTRLALSYTRLAPIKIQSSDIQSYDGTNTTLTAADYQYNFSTIALTGHYTFIGSDEQPFSFYGMITAGYVSVKEKHVPRKDLPSNTISSNKEDDQKESGVIGALGLGLQYQVGPVAPFADASFAYPSTRDNTYYSANPIPLHFTFNVGIRIPFGTRSFDE